jgi:uncharacterized surface protein with fasciclin (FAS1) repeats
MFRTALLTVAIAALSVGAAPIEAGNCSSSDARQASAHADRPDIVDTAVAAGSFQTLAAALGVADLVDVLKGEGPFTVFAPTDAAFAKLPEGTVEDLLKPKNREKLVAILTYHVVPGNVKAADAVKAKRATTVEGSKVEIGIEKGRLTVDNATIIDTDIEASNGVIHVIDEVIIPSHL